jgi:ABC-2 type transport system ATP-binding protein
VILIGDGQILSQGTVEDLRRLVSSERRLIVDVEDEDADVSDPEAEVVQRDGHRVHLRFDPERTPAPQLIARVTRRWEVRDLFVEHPPIEEVVAAYYESQAGAVPSAP